MHRRTAVLVIGAFMVAGCGGASSTATTGTTDAPTTTASQPQLDSNPAVWLVDPKNVTTATAAFTAAVHAHGCDDGTTPANEPTIEYHETAIVITFTTEPLPPGSSTCVGGSPVFFDVKLREPIGKRQLVDGGCADEPLSRTSWCDSDGSVRWKP